MDKIFHALGHPIRLWVMTYLAANGPSRQVDILNALRASDSEAAKVSAGAMTQLLRPLLDAGLVARDRPRGPLSLVQGEQIGRLLTTASALAVATATDSSEDAHRRHSELMRAIASAVPNIADADK